jgi:hypothetical protein
MSTEACASIAVDQTSSAEAPKAETPAVETPKVEAHKSEAAKIDSKIDIKSDIKTDIEASIASVIKSKFAARPRASRYAVLAASITIAAALGSVAGALTGAVLMRSEPATSIERTVTADALNTTLTQLSADLTSLKAALDSGSKATNTQLSKLSERVERAEKSQAEAAQKTARLLETPKSPAQIPTDVTGSIVEKQQVRPPIVEGWVIRDIFDGRAMVESRSHGIYEVGPGAPLPGVGKVEAVRRQDGRWVVVTPKGLIVSAR